MMNTLSRAHRRWAKDILPKFVDRKFLTNRHGPCPLCGGKDRYRFDDKWGEGNYYCAQCGPGTGFIMLRKLKGWHDAKIFSEVDAIIGMGDVAPQPMSSKPKIDPAAREHWTKSLIDHATHPDIVERYLRHRGLTVSSPVLLGAKDIKFKNADGTLWKYSDAVIAPIHAADGKLESAQRIYTDELLLKGGRKQTMPPIRTINGGAVRLFPDPAWEMGIAEGIENALAAFELFGIPTWAALNEGNLQLFRPPADICALHIYGDNDLNFVGQRAAYLLANKLHEIHNAKGTHTLAIEVHIPPVAGTDWLDVLTGQGDPA
jgi:putative DNA primase/helicase